jgi:hypothetical protein
VQNAKGKSVDVSDKMLKKDQALKVTADTIKITDKTKTDVIKQATNERQIEIN